MPILTEAHASAKYVYIYISSGHAFRQSCLRICYAIIIIDYTQIEIAI